MVDSHCHLADEAFVADLPAVVARAEAAGIAHAMCILEAGDRSELERAAALVALWPRMRFATGVHPHHAGLYADRPEAAADVTRAALSGTPLARAVGEIGLDYHYDFAPRDVQQEVFRQQLRLARELDFPVVVHTRDADEDTFRLIREEGEARLRGVFHCFTGDIARAARVLDLGFCVSFAGIVTFPRAAALREAAGIVPSDRLLVETDAPYLAPVPHRGHRNEPAWVARVVEAIADARGATPAAVADAVTHTFTTLIRP